MRCHACDCRHYPACSGESDPADCRPEAREGRHRRSRFASSLLGWPARTLPSAPAEPADSGKVRVGFWSPVFMPAGGTETWHKTLLPRLAGDDVEVTGLAVQIPGMIDHVGARALGCPVLAGDAGLAAIAERSDVLVTWGLAEPETWLPPRGDPRRPVVVGVSHGDGSFDYWRTLQSSASGSIDLFVAVSEAARGAIPDARRSDTVVLLNAVDPERVRAPRCREIIRTGLGLSPADVAVLYLGRLAPEKRPELVARAAAHLPERFKVLIAGDGELAGAVAAIAAALPDGRVRLLGRREDVGELLKAADVVVSPSREEGFGLAIAEAMAASVPVVATRCGFLVDRPGLALLVPHESGPLEWARAIAAGAEPGDDRIWRVRQAAGFVETRLDVHHHVASWAELVRTIGRRDGRRVARAG